MSDLLAFPSPLPAQRTDIECSCGMPGFGCWGPEAAVGPLRLYTCWSCQRVWMFRPDPERGLPEKVVFNPADPSVGIAWWSD